MFSIINKRGECWAGQILNIHSGWNVEVIHYDYSIDKALCQEN
jgi:hypothetical protein